MKITKEQWRMGFSDFIDFIDVSSFFPNRFNCIRCEQIRNEKRGIARIKCNYDTR